jgi:hypothetical protein
VRERLPGHDLERPVEPLHHAAVHVVELRKARLREDLAGEPAADALVADREDGPVAIGLELGEPRGELGVRDQN